MQKKTAGWREGDGTRILTTGLMIQNNLGCPSLLHGFYALCGEIYGDRFRMLNTQSAPVDPASASDMPFDTVCSGKKVLPLLWTAVKRKLRLPCKDTQALFAVDLIRSADCVVDLYGICFCDNLTYVRPSLPRRMKYLLWFFPIPFIAKWFGVPVIKNTASYGPMLHKGNRLCARYAASHLFSAMLCREKKSMDAMREAGVRRPLILSPDTANLMPCPPLCDRDGEPVVGISVSHQIVRQWKADMPYETCIAALCRHIHSSRCGKILLIPNETDWAGSNDTDVALRIVHQLRSDNIPVEILDAGHMTGMAVKSQIATCTVMVASRYHSCVAALSTGVPLLVVGWHYKYEELLTLYGQEDRMLRNENCSPQQLIAAFDLLWKDRTSIRQTLSDRGALVRRQVIEAGKEAFACIKPR